MLTPVHIGEGLFRVDCAAAMRLAIQEVLDSVPVPGNQSGLKCDQQRDITEIIANGFFIDRGVDDETGIDGLLFLGLNGRPDRHGQRRWCIDLRLGYIELLGALGLHIAVDDLAIGRDRFVEIKTNK